MAITTDPTAVIRMGTMQRTIMHTITAMHLVGCSASHSF